MKKTYQITFKAELTEDDVRAMNKYFYDTMNESMEISEVWDLAMKEIDDDEGDSLEDLHVYTMHFDDVIDGLNDCDTIEEVRSFIETIPNKFGSWWIDIKEIAGERYYEVTNQYCDENGETQIDTYELAIEVEEED